MYFEVIKSCSFAMVTYYVEKMTVSYSPVISYLFDTIIVVSDRVVALICQSVSDGNAVKMSWKENLY